MDLYTSRGMFHTDLTFIFTILHHSLISKHHFYKMYLFSHTHPQSVYFLMIIFSYESFPHNSFFCCKRFLFSHDSFHMILFFHDSFLFKRDSIFTRISSSFISFSPRIHFSQYNFFLHESFPKLIHLLSRFTYFSLDFAHLFTFSDSFFSRSFYFHII